MATLLPVIKAKFTDSNGRPLAGGKLWSYLANSSTPAATYTDNSGDTANTNPVELDAAGEADIWLKPGSYKFILWDADDVPQYTVDNVAPADGGGGGIIDADYAYTGFSARFNEQFDSAGLNDTLELILNISYVAPTISLAASGSGTIREKGTSVASTNLSATITKKSDAIDEVRFYLNPASLLDTQTSGGAIPAGGVSAYAYATPFTDNVTFRAEVDDNGATGGPTTVSSTTSFTFVYPYYNGAGVAGKTAAQVAALTKSLIVSTATVNKTMTAAGGNVFYFAQPAAYTALTSILDVNNFETIADWSVSTANITGLDGNAVSYRIYEFNNPVTAGDYFYSFRR